MKAREEEKVDEKAASPAWSQRTLRGDTGLGLSTSLTVGELEALH